MSHHFFIQLSTMWRFNDLIPSWDLILPQVRCLTDDLAGTDNLAARCTQALNSQVRWYMWVRHSHEPFSSVLDYHWGDECQGTTILITNLHLITGQFQDYLWDYLRGCLVDHLCLISDSISNLISGQLCDHLHDCPMIVSVIVSLIISIWSPVNSVTNFVTISVVNSIFWTPTSLKPRILALVFGKPWPKIEGLYVHLLSNVTLFACIYWWSHWWWVLRLFSLDILIIRWDPLASCPSIDSLWISPSSACVTSTCCLGCPNRRKVLSNKDWQSGCQLPP